MWVKQLCDNSHGSWKCPAQKVLSPYEGVHFNCLPADIIKLMDRPSGNVPTVYIDMIRSWFKIKEKDVSVSGLQLDPTEIRNRIIWGNSLIIMH